MKYESIKWLSNGKKKKSRPETLHQVVNVSIGNVIDFRYILFITPKHEMAATCMDSQQQVSTYTYLLGVSKAFYYRF